MGDFAPAENGSRTGVVYVADSNYHDITEFSLAAFAIQHDRPLDFHFFQIGYERDLTPGVMSQTQERGHRVKLHSVDKSRVPASASASKRFHAHISSASVFKAMAIDSLVDDYDKLVYIDGDVLALSPIDFGDIDVSDNLFGAVYDFVSYMPYDGQDIIRHATRTGVSPDYFNAGFLCINSRKWKSSGAIGRFHENLRKHDTFCPYRHDSSGKYSGDCKSWDQCVFNMTAENDWKPLPMYWNAQRPIRHTRVWADAVVRHYTGPKKFLPIRSRYCDRREYRQMQQFGRLIQWDIDGERQYDGGLSFYLDKLRYWRETALYNGVIAELTARREGWSRQASSA